MEKRIFGIILTVLGVIGIIWAAISFVQGHSGTATSIKAITVYGILGLIFFFAGIGLIKSTKDNPS